MKAGHAGRSSDRKCRSLPGTLPRARHKHGDTTGELWRARVETCRPPPTCRGRRPRGAAAMCRPRRPRPAGGMPAGERRPGDRWPGERQPGNDRVVAVRPAPPGTRSCHPQEAPSSARSDRLYRGHDSSSWQRRPKVVSAASSGLSPLATSQLGYKYRPARHYCNRFSAYWQPGPRLPELGPRRAMVCRLRRLGLAPSRCPFRLRPGPGRPERVLGELLPVGVAHRTWHPVGSGYVPQPGDVAVYGLDLKFAGPTRGDRDQLLARCKGPNVVNGDGDGPASASSSPARPVQVRYHG